MNADDESNITEIELLTDGRVCVFGTSVEVLEVLDELQHGADRAVTDRLDLWRHAALTESAVNQIALVAENVDERTKG